MTALSACCAFDGGFSTGVRLLMESASPLRCATLSNISSDVVFCECSDENQRYDIQTSSCISSCNSGERWEYVDSNEYDTITSKVGRCVECSVGTFSVGSVNSWIDTCSNCTAGAYTSTDGKSECSQCDSGTYSSSDGMSECDKCVAGTYSEFVKGSSRCLNCTAGTYTSTDEKSECTQCDGGTYTSLDGQSQCQTCPRGKHSDLTIGSTECVECIPGRFSSQNSTTLCSPCPRGRYSTQNASRECKICTSGHHTEGFELGSTSCVQCDVGTFYIFLLFSSSSTLFSSHDS